MIQNNILLILKRNDEKQSKIDVLTYKVIKK